jgi:inorganic pyrophosphatase
MSALTIHVSRTAGTGQGHLRDWALGSGRLPEALGPDAEPLDALVLMHEPAPAGVDVAAEPIALLHLRVDGVAHDEVLCACSGEPAEQVLAGLRRTGFSDGLLTAVRRLHPGHACAILGGEDPAEARYVVAEAFERYLQTTGALQ